MEEMTYEVTAQNADKKKKKKLIFFSVLTVLAIMIIIAVCIFTGKTVTKITPQNINEITGCPEFRDIKWNMNQTDVLSKIDTEYKLKDSVLLVNIYEKFDLYGKKPTYAFVIFDNVTNLVNQVTLTFKKENYTFNEIVELYTQIYGEASRKYPGSYRWRGEKTEIWIDNGHFDPKDSISVNYNADF